MPEKVQQGGINASNADVREHVPERRMWLAVLVQAVEEWRRGNLRARREAELFLLKDEKDFHQVCAAAGLDSRVFREKLVRLQPSQFTSPQPAHLRLHAA